MAAGAAIPPRSSRSESALKPGGGRWILLFIAIAIGMSMRTAGPAALSTAFDRLRLDSMAAVASLLEACFLSIVLHECGHLLAAISLGFEVVGGSLGPFRAMRVNGRWQFQFTGGNLFRGSVAAVPEIGGFWRARTMVIVVAGPLVTLVAGVISAVVLGHQTGAHPFWAAMAELNLLLFALLLIPTGTKAAPSDARLFFDLLKNGDSAAEIARCFGRMRQHALTASDTNRAA